jgi:O-methyltransferase
MTPEDLYLDLLKRCLTRAIFPPRLRPFDHDKRRSRRWKQRVGRHLSAALRRHGLMLMEPASPPDPKTITEGTIWPDEAETMIGLERLDSLQACVIDLLRRRVPGDLIETGVWRGGTTIFMRAILEAYRDPDRLVWVADSFEGLPKAEWDRYPNRKGGPVDDLWKANDYLGVSVEQVRANFLRYGLLDERVKFLPGWFKDTLPLAPIRQLALMRLDGDLYDSTMDALKHLYPKLSVGGYVIVDDYGCIPACRQAVHDFRQARGTADEIRPIDWTGVYWRRSA